MKPTQRPLAALLCVVMLSTSACSTLWRGASASPEFMLLAPHTLGAERSVYQQVHWQRNDDNHHLDIALDIRQHSLHMVVLTSLGRRLATLNYEDGQYQIKREPGAPAKIPYRQLLADIQMIFWPLSALNADTRNSDWDFKQQGQRTAWYDGRLIAQISATESWSWRGSYHYQNLVDGHQLRIQSVLLP